MAAKIEKMDKMEAVTKRAPKTRAAKVAKPVAKRPEFTIDATGKSLGRVASEVAMHLRGKTGADFMRHTAPGIKVKVTNAASMRILEKRLKSKRYARYSGYPGGLRYETLDEVITKKGYGEALKETVIGMIPSNKLRPAIMKNLTITD